MTGEANDVGNDGDSSVHEHDYAATAGEAKTGPNRTPPSARSLGRYALLKVLGEGGMGTVHLAYDPALDRRVALKVIRAQGKFSDDASYCETLNAKLLDEARTLAALAHPNVVPIFDIGTLDDRVYMAMEYVDGIDLRQWCQSERRSWQSIVACAMAAGRGLAAAHESGLVHHDFKPDNVMVGHDGRICVLDFGLASRERKLEDHCRSGQLQETQLDGTLAYMPHEQLLGGDCDARGDQFAFCVSLYECLYDSRPFAPCPLEQRASHLQAGPEVPDAHHRAGPRWLYEIVSKGLHADPDQRYASMHVLLDELEQRLQRRTRRAHTAWASAGLIGLTSLGMFASEQLLQVKTACPGIESRWATTWGPQQRERAAEGFRGTQLAYAGHSWNAVDDALVEFGDQWTSQYGQACRNPVPSLHERPALHDLQLACFRRSYDHAAALAQQFISADADVVEQAIQALSGIPRLSDCTDLEQLESGIQLPTDPAQRRRVELARQRMDEAIAIVAAGRRLTPAQLRQLAQAVDSAQFKALRAEYEFFLANTIYQHNDVDRAIEHFERAKVDALAIGHREIVANASLQLVFFRGYLKNQRARVASLLEEARAASRAAGSKPEFATRLLHYEAIVAAMVGDHESSLAHFTNALAQLRSAAEFDRIRYMDVLKDAGLERAYAGQTTAAIETMREAQSMGRQIYGDDHPELIHGEENLAIELRNIGELQEAAQLFQHALTLCLNNHTPTTFRCLNITAQIANVARLLGDVATALEASSHVADIQERSGVRGPSYMSWEVVSLAYLYESLGYFEHSRQLAKLAHEYIATDLHMAGGHKASILQLQARLLRADGRPGAAWVALARAQRQARGSGLGLETRQQQLSWESAELTSAEGNDAAAVLVFERLLAARLERRRLRHPDDAVAMMRIARSLLTLGETSAASHYTDWAQTIFAQLFAPENPRWSEIYTLRGELALARGRSVEARHWYESARERFDIDLHHPAMQATMFFGLARALGPADPDAKEWARRALTAFESQYPRHQSEAKACRSWLTAHGLHPRRAKRAP